MGGQRGFGSTPRLRAARGGVLRSGKLRETSDSDRDVPRGLIYQKHSAGWYGGLQSCLSTSMVDNPSYGTDDPIWPFVTVDSVALPNRGTNVHPGVEYGGPDGFEVGTHELADGRLLLTINRCISYYYKPPAGAGDTFDDYLSAVSGTWPYVSATDGKYKTGTTCVMPAPSSPPPTPPPPSPSPPEAGDALILIDLATERGMMSCTPSHILAQTDASAVSYTHLTLPTKA